MRKVIVSNFTSLDGYVAGVDNDVMALPFDPSFDVLQPGTDPQRRHPAHRSNHL